MTFEKLYKRVSTLRFQRNHKNEDGNDIYLWYYSSETIQSWRFSSGQRFHDRTDLAWMTIDSEGIRKVKIERLQLLFKRSYHRSK